jgi:hypothetical protein
VNRTVVALALSPLFLLAACGGDSQSGNNAASPQVDTEALKAHTQELLDRWGCLPLEEPLSTNGAPGAFPGAPFVEAKCRTGHTSANGFPESATLTVYTSPQAKDENVAYSASQIGGTTCLGDDWALSDAMPLAKWVQITGCTVR